MKNVIIIGASGNIARRVTDMLLGREDIHLTLFVRSGRRLGKRDLSGAINSKIDGSKTQCI